MSCKRDQDVSYCMIVVAIAFAAAVITTIVTGPNRVTFGDAADYANSARALLRGHYPRESPYFPIFRPPLYPILMAMIWKVTGTDNWLAIKVIQAGLFSTTCWLLYRLGALVFKARHPALCGALLYSLYPFALLQTVDIQTEVLHTLLVVATVYALSRSLLAERLNLGWLGLTGVWIGLATLCRPSALPIGLCLGCLCPLLCIGTDRLLRRCKGVLITLTTCMLVIAPWTYLNWRASGDFILVSDATGYQLWMGNHPALRAVYEQNFSTRQAFGEYVNGYLQGSLVQEKIHGWEKTERYSSLSLGRRERLWRSEALKNMRENASTTARLWIDKTLNFWRPWLLPSAYPPLLVFFSGLAITNLYIFAIVGAAFLSRGDVLPLAAYKTRSLLILGLLFFSSTIVHTIFHAMMRFRLPYVDPFLCMLAGPGVWLAVRYVLTRSRLSA